MNIFVNRIPESKRKLRTLIAFFDIIPAHPINVFRGNLSLPEECLYYLYLCTKTQEGVEMCQEK